MKKSLSRLVTAFACLAVAGCAVSPGGRDYAARERSGLGTAWGEEMDSAVEPVRFGRAARPLAVETLFYNDRAGLRELAGGRFTSTRWFESADGSISYGLKKAGWAGMWRGFTWRGRHYVEGAEGERYEIVVRNRTREPLALVVSVDGLNALDGRPATTRGGQGYLVGGGQTLTVPGFRRSLDEVAAFRFSRVSRSYAAQATGVTRNVGVIGLAVYPGEWSRLGHDRAETRRREDADPFPGRFARPPAGER